MKIKLRYFIFTFLTFFVCEGQTVSIVGTGVNGWPGSAVGPEIVLSTTDNINFTIANLVVTDGAIKFRRDLSWAINWGGNTFPNGVGISNGSDIPTVAGTYDVTFNISNATYTFINSMGFANIGIWGPAVDSQNGYAGPDVDMSTIDGVNYTLSGFNFSSGQAYFRQGDAANFVWGGTAYPAGNAVMNGPSLFIPGGEHFVSFNRVTGDYTFSFPSIGVLGTALNGYEVADTDLTTVDGFNYTISNLSLTSGTLKFRKDDSWIANWGADSFPNGIGIQNGVNIPVAVAGTYSINFNRVTGEYFFGPLLHSNSFNTEAVKIYPNPTHDNWNIISANNQIESVQVFDMLGKCIATFLTKNFNVTINTTLFETGIYFLKITTDNVERTFKVLKR